MLASQRGFRVLAALTITLSAFLLFQVQPLIGKVILPWFGGSPAVWTTSMLFFQLLLLAGYAYADVLVRFVRPRWQLMVHLVVLALAIATLPIMPGERWKPKTGDQPLLHVLQVLAIAIGLPYFAVSATAPLVQAWYARALPRGTPYRLYSLSNIGSLAALLSYPFLVERLFSIHQQSGLWSVLFAVFAVCCAALAWYATRFENRGAGAEPAPDNDSAGESKEILKDQPLRATRIVLWLVYPALAVTVLLALTNHLCRDVAVVPFLWVAPLTLYLLSFIICFDRDRWYAPRAWAVATVITSSLVLSLFISAYLDSGMEWISSRFNKLNLPYELAFVPSEYLHHILVEGVIYLSWMFCACMLCHGELVRLKPPARSLTVFYLCVATGGALGGLFVAMICPTIFSGYWEFNLVQVAVFALASIVLLKPTGKRPGLYRSPLISIPVITILGSLMLLQLWVHYETIQAPALIRLRNFYGVLTVQQKNETGEPEDEVYELYHGRILHGIQLKHESRTREPTTYYTAGSGPALAIQHLRERKGNIRIGVLGLGTGSISCWAQKGDAITFYEINSNVLKLQGDYFKNLPGAATDEYFSYLRECPAEVNLVYGDARIQMESQPPQDFDVLFMDAFSGDAVPMHLLTVEAIDVYRQHLKPDGILAIHVSNLFLCLDPVVEGLALHAGMHYAKIQKNGDQLHEASSDWILLSAGDELLKDTNILERQSSLESPYDDGKPHLPIYWTDEYSNLFDVLRW